MRERSEEPYKLRPAALADTPELSVLIARSIRVLGAAHYTSAQLDAALMGTFGVDSALIRDGSYYAIMAGEGRIVGCGGWSRRRTLFGGDTRAERDDAMLDPALEPARIRAFFIDPDHARRGLGRWMLAHCEAQAEAAGFRAFELMATLPGQPLYAECGYVPGAAIAHPLPGGQSITLVPMSKRLA